PGQLGRVVRVTVAHRSSSALLLCCALPQGAVAGAESPAHARTAPAPTDTTPGETISSESPRFGPDLAVDARSPGPEGGCTGPAHTGGLTPCWCEAPTGSLVAPVAGPGVGLPGPPPG